MAGRNIVECTIQVGGLGRMRGSPIGSMASYEGQPPKVLGRTWTVSCGFVRLVAFEEWYGVIRKRSMFLSVWESVRQLRAGGAPSSFWSPGGSVDLDPVEEESPRLMGSGVTEGRGIEVAQLICACLPE